MYVMYKEGVTSRNWCLIDDINSNLTANIKTKYGDTREIKIGDSIRQGGVLSVAQYALLMDEISKSNQTKNIGLQINNKVYLNTLLWMDDVVLITDCIDDMKTLLDNTYDIATRYHIIFGQEKSKILQIGKDKNNPNNSYNFTLGQQKLEYTNNYKYLGTRISQNNKLTNQLDNIIGKTEAAFQTIINIMYNEDFLKFQMSTVWKLVEVCIIPVIVYDSETWNLTKKDKISVNRILDNILKRILKTPTSKPFT